MCKYTWKDALVFWPYSSCECFGKQISNIIFEKKENCISRPTEKQRKNILLKILVNADKNIGLWRKKIIKYWYDYF